MIDKQLFKAESLIERGRYEEAKNILTEALAGSPDHPEVLSLLAFVYRLQKDLPTAESFAQAAVQNAPEAAHAWRELAIVLVNQENREKEDQTLQALEMWKRYSNAESEWYVFAGRFEWSRKNLKKSEQLLSEGLKNYPEEEDLLFYYGLLLAEQHELDKAKVITERLSKVASDGAGFWSLKGFVELKSGHLEESEVSLRESLRINPNSEYTLNALKSSISKRNSVLHYLFRGFDSKKLLLAFGVFIFLLIIGMILGRKSGLFLPFLVVGLSGLRWTALAITRSYSDWVLGLYEAARPLLPSRVLILSKISVIVFFIWLAGMSFSLVWPKHALIIILSSGLFFELFFNFAFYLSFLPSRMMEPMRWMHLLLVSALGIAGFYFQEWGWLAAFYSWVILNSIVLAALRNEQEEEQQEFSPKAQLQKKRIPQLLYEGNQALAQKDYAQAKAIFTAVLERSPKNEAARRGLLSVLETDDTEIWDMLFFPVWKPKLNWRSIIQVGIMFVSFPAFVMGLAIYFIFAWYFGGLLNAIIQLDKSYRLLLPARKNWQGIVFIIGSLTILVFFLAWRYTSATAFYDYAFLSIGLLFWSLALLEADSWKGRISTALAGGLLLYSSVSLYREIQELSWLITMIMTVLFAVLFSFRLIGGKREKVLAASMAE